MGPPENCCAAQLEISAMNKDAFEVDMARIYQVICVLCLFDVWGRGLWDCLKFGFYLKKVGDRGFVEVRVFI